MKSGNSENQEKKFLQHFSCPIHHFQLAWQENVWVGRRWWWCCHPVNMTGGGAEQISQEQGALTSGSILVHSQATTFSLARCTLDRKVQVAYFFQLSQYKEVVTSLSASESLRWQFQVFNFVFWSSAWFPPDLPSCNFLNWKSLLGFIDLYFALMGQLENSVFLTRFGNLLTFQIIVICSG